jgi:hypothetical protein
MGCKRNTNHGCGGRPDHVRAGKGFPKKGNLLPDRPVIQLLERTSLAVCPDKDVSRLPRTADHGARQVLLKEPICFARACFKAADPRSPLSNGFLLRGLQVRILLGSPMISRVCAFCSG